MDDAGLIILVLLLYLVGLALVIAVLALLALGVSYAFKLWPQHRRKVVKVLAGAGIAIGAAIAVMYASGMIEPAEPDPGDEKHLVAAAKARVKSEFRQPEKVQFQEVWLGKERYEKTVCGSVDSDEITNASRFIFTTDPMAPQSKGSGARDSGREGDRLRMDVPPTVEGSKPTDSAYWEKLAGELSSFNFEWNELCDKQRPGADKNEER